MIYYKYGQDADPQYYKEILDDSLDVFINILNDLHLHKYFRFNELINESYKYNSLYIVFESNDNARECGSFRSRSKGLNVVSTISINVIKICKYYNEININSISSKTIIKIKSVLIHELFHMYHDFSRKEFGKALTWEHCINYQHPSKTICVVEALADFFSYIYLYNYAKCYELANDLENEWKSNDPSMKAYSFAHFLLDSYRKCSNFSKFISVLEDSFHNFTKSYNTLIS